MADFIRRHSILLASLLLLVSSFQLMSASIQDPWLPRLGGRFVNGAISPIQGFHRSFVDSGTDIWTHYLYLVNVESERAELASRVKALEAQNSRLIEFENENSRLRGLLSLQQETGWNGVIATVIGRDPSNWIRTITIDRGEVDGVRPGQTVVDGHAIVGQTTVVSERSAKILLLTDSRSAIDALVQSSRSPGIVEGTGFDFVRLNYVLREQEVKVGDRVIASGLDGVYPKGALIGVVTSVATNPENLFHSIEVRPSVDIARLESLLVVIPERSHPKDFSEPSLSASNPATVDSSLPQEKP